MKKPVLIALLVPLMATLTACPDNDNAAAETQKNTSGSTAQNGTAISQQPVKEIETPDIKSRVIKIIVDKLGVNESKVVMQASFCNDLGADSLAIVELIMEFEKEFNISIPDEQAETITTVGKAVAYLESHVN